MKFTGKLMSEEGKARALEAYFASLNHTVDDYYRKAVLGKARAMAVYAESARVGFYLVDGDDSLVLWDFKPPFMHMSQAWLGEMLENGRFSSALVSTRQSSFLSLCMDFCRDLSVDAYLFEPQKVLQDLKKPERDLVFDLADFEDIARCREIVGEPYPGYLKALYQQQGLYVLKGQGQVVAMGELRVDESCPNFADLGMATAPAHRRKGLAAYMISRLLVEARKQGLIANASCDSSNIGSKKSLEKAGMAASHRMLRVKF